MILYQQVIFADCGNLPVADKVSQTGLKNIIALRLSNPANAPVSINAPVSTPSQSLLFRCSSFKFSRPRKVLA